MPDWQRHPQRWSDGGMLVIAMVWGANFVVIKAVLAEIPPMFYLGLRFALAFAILVCVSPKAFTHTRLSDICKAVGVGALLFGAFAAQTVGLGLTVPGMSAFLTVTYVAMVPLIQTISQRRAPGINVIVGAALALGGTGWLSLSGDLLFGRGELLTLLGALFFALHILALDQITGAINSLVLTGMQIGTLGLLALLAAFVWETAPATISAGGVAAIVYGALFGSIGGYLVQTVAQRYTPPAHAAILLSMEAVFALAFSLAAGMETVGPGRLAGFVLVLVGVLALELLPGRSHLG